MGVHTGDSITVAPAQTLTDKEYQKMRLDAFKIIREIGVETGGSNIQFAVCPQSGKQIVIEMNHLKLLLITFIGKSVFILRSLNRKMILRH